MVGMLHVGLETAVAVDLAHFNRYRTKGTCTARLCGCQRAAAERASHFSGDLPFEVDRVTPRPNRAEWRQAFHTPGQASTRCDDDDVHPHNRSDRGMYRRQESRPSDAKRSWITDARDST